MCGPRGDRGRDHPPEISEGFSPRCSAQLFGCTIPSGLEPNCNRSNTILSGLLGVSSSQNRGRFSAKSEILTREDVHGLYPDEIEGVGACLTLIAGAMPI
ncbi:hypothetical protein PGT21_002412 [Puccinia graminis f. sp. tritici]|uniref:Uncharacterized protein n=1 Tax=Puccinia graminis f. sp. tritici TaxID=56615 RepID=A0A5B0QHT8_PUCGR|nr:hypothetical protein PGT21_002412 [Puccinia graminis f. sp. tritici]